MYIYHHICLDPRAILMKLDLLWQTLLWPALIRRIRDFMNHGECVWTVGSLVHSTEEYMVSYIWRNTHIYIYTVWIYHITSTSTATFSFRAQGCVTLAFPTWPGMYRHGKIQDAMAERFHVTWDFCRSLRAWSTLEANIPRGRRSQWMNSIEAGGSMGPIGNPQPGVYDYMTFYKAVVLNRVWNPWYVRIEIPVIRIRFHRRGTRPGDVKIAIENDPVEIVDFPSCKMVDLSSSLCKRLPGRAAGHY